MAVSASAAFAQNYTSYRTGAPGGVDPVAQGGICLMGGATENDNAMVWFLERASGGDVVVLRASGSDGYNDYMYSDLGGINSVETIVLNDPTAAFEPYVHQRILDAEAIWFAGGDQWDYVDYWRGTPIDSLVREAVNVRNVAIGGTSAGMAILGGIQFTAENGTVSSAQALNNPYANNVTLSDDLFMDVPLMDGIITDTHYDDPDRRGRHFAFLAHAMDAFGLSDVRGIACNEYTAVCIDPAGEARVYGDYPSYDEFAFFLRANCAVPNGPEVCEPGTPLTWDRTGAAVQVYKVPGVQSGTNGMNIATWDNGIGGTWEHWRAVEGVFSTTTGSAWECATGISTAGTEGVRVSYDPLSSVIIVTGGAVGATVQVVDVHGRVLRSTRIADGRWDRIAIAGIAAQLLVVTVEGAPITRVVVPQ